MHKNLRRSVVALATAFACLGILASPASAATHAVTITGGTVVAINATGTTTITSTLGGTTGVGCASTINANVTTATSQVDVTTFASTGHFTLGTTHYVATMSRTSSTAGTYTGTTSGGNISSLTLAISVQIRAAANNTSTNVDCTTTGTLLCTLRATLHLAGTYTGNLDTAGATVALSTTGTAAITLGIGTCAVPFSTFNGGTATVTGLTGVSTT